jgi:hypothetical protein
MDVYPNTPADKPAPAVRDRLPDRRAALSTSFERDGWRLAWHHL